MLLSPLLLPRVQDLSWPRLLSRALLSVGATQHVPLPGHLLPHRLLCYPAVEVPQPALPFGHSPAPSHLVTCFLGLHAHYLPPCPDHGNACNFSLPCKWETPRKSFCRAQTLEGHWYSHASKHLHWDLQRNLGKPPPTGFRVTCTSHSLSHSKSWSLLQRLSA